MGLQKHEQPSEEVMRRYQTARRLYVDGVQVAEDEPSLLPHISVGFHIGCGANKEPGSFFSGLIDDVRIYNRAVKP
jgi:hypothetical protein